jgi:hypothetical protein
MPWWSELSPADRSQPQWTPVLCWFLGAHVYTTQRSHLSEGGVVRTMLCCYYYIVRLCVSLSVAAALVIELSSCVFADSAWPLLTPYSMSDVCVTGVYNAEWLSECNCQLLQAFINRETPCLCDNQAQLYVVCVCTLNLASDIVASLGLWVRCQLIVCVRCCCLCANQKPQLCCARVFKLQYSACA